MFLEVRSQRKVDCDDLEEFSVSKVCLCYLLCKGIRVRISFISPGHVGCRRCLMTRKKAMAELSFSLDHKNLSETSPGLHGNGGFRPCRHQGGFLRRLQVWASSAEVETCKLTGHKTTNTPKPFPPYP